MSRIILLLLLAVSQIPLGVAAPAKAPSPDSEPAVKEFRFEYQLRRVDQRAIRLIGADHQKTLRHMAEAAVLADFCPALKLDQDRFKHDFDALGAVGPKRKLDEQRAFENRLMTLFGIYVGLLVAEGAESQVEFCELADDMKHRQGPVSRYWLAEPAPAPAAARP